MYANIVFLHQGHCNETENIQNSEGIDATKHSKTSASRTLKQMEMNTSILQLKLMKGLMQVHWLIADSRETRRVVI